MKIQFIGVGSQFSDHDQYHSNLLVTAQSGKRMLVDCGSDVRFSLTEQKVKPADLDAVYISHLHADHIGGLEWLALSTYFETSAPPLKLFGEGHLLKRLWEHSLKGGLECLGGERKQLADYFDCQPLTEEKPFDWEEITYTMIKMPHVACGDCDHCSYGLTLKTAGDPDSRIFISTDTTYQPEVLKHIAEEADLIFHDCETTRRKTTVHAHYEQLRTLPLSVKRKTWLYHYQPGSGYNPLKDGFLGFVRKGQQFAFPEHP